MKYFAAFLPMLDQEKSRTLRPRHLAFLEEQDSRGKILARGPFTDGSGGLVIYRASSLEEAQDIAASDPYVTEGARRLELHEWAMRTRSQ
jgi:uncharacterized protein YciI